MGAADGGPGGGGAATKRRAGELGALSIIDTPALEVLDIPVEKYKDRPQVSAGLPQPASGHWPEPATTTALLLYCYSILFSFG